MPRQFYGPYLRLALCQCNLISKSQNPDRANDI